MPPTGARAYERRGGLILGGILILVGLFFLAERAFDINLGRYGWPLFILVPGVSCLVMAGEIHQV